MIVFDYKNDEYFNLFYIWQNDFCVFQGWNEMGMVEQYREYFCKVYEDFYQIIIFVWFDDVCFVYFEVYWGKVCFFYFFY